VVRESVQHQVLLGREVPEEGRLGYLGRRGDVVDRDPVEAVRQEQRDRRVGPTGLTLACDLARRGVAVRIVDRVPEFPGGSRGKGLSPRSLEVFDDLAVIDRMLASGITHMPHRKYQGAEVIAEIDPEAGRVPTPGIPYPAGLMIPQWRVEQILRERLADFGVAVELGAELRSFSQHADGVTATIGEARFQQTFDRIAGVPGVRLRSLAWRSSYRVNVRMVDQLQVDRVFLAGDAAHVHPIAGGLGMNSGIQDAYNLGWKLGLVLAGNAASGLLGTYESERLPIAGWLLDITSERLNVALDAIKEKGGGVDAVATPELTQLTLRYPWSRLSRQTTSRPTGPRPGDRAPDAPLRDAATGTPTRLFDLFRGPHFTLLGLGERCVLGLGERCVPALGDVETGIVKPYLVGPGGLLDDGGHVARAYGTDALILIRPDGHIGLVAHPTETGSVGEYLRSL
jgi:2-polyprenyl-6-methoxyphenol hydroxylase-like FAD-dependent oxidoreductase